MSDVAVIKSTNNLKKQEYLSVDVHLSVNQEEIVVFVGGMKRIEGKKDCKDYLNFIVYKRSDSCF